MHDSVLTVDVTDDIINIPGNNQSHEKNDQEIIYELLEKLSDEGLTKLINEIDDEKELRKLRNQRMTKLKNELKAEKNKMLKEINSIKIKMLKTVTEENSDESDDDKKKPKKSLKRKK